MQKFLCAASLAFTLCMGAVAGPEIANAGTIRIANTTWIGWGPLYLASDLGYYKKLGLDLQMPVVNETRDAFTALASGRVDGVGDTVDDMLSYRSPKVCFKSVVVLDESYGGDGILVAPDIHSLSDLRGKTVALDTDSVSSFWLHYLLNKAAIPDDTVKTVDMSADDAAVAFIAGRVPAAVTWEPNLTFAVSKSKGKGKVLVDSKTTPGVIIDTIVLSCDEIQNHPKDVQALVTGYYQALAYLSAHPAQAQALMAKSIGGWLSNPSDVADSLSHVRFYDKPANLAYFGASKKPGPISTLIADADRVWSKLQNKPESVTPDEVVDWSFING